MTSSTLLLVDSYGLFAVLSMHVYNAPLAAPLKTRSLSSQSDLASVPEQLVTT